MGAGTITIPYIFYKNGLILGTFFVILGGLLSFYSGYLIAYCSMKTNSRCYEEIAYHLYGSKGMKITNFCTLCCNIGFLISYAVLFKETLPYVLEMYYGEDLPDIIGNTWKGKTMWCTLFCYVFLLPLSLPRELNKLAFTSFISFTISIFIVLTIFSLSFKS